MGVWPDVSAPTGTILTVVGTGESGTGGLCGPALRAQIQTPTDLAFDAAGNLYIAERFGNRILKVDASSAEGTVTVVAGTGELSLDPTGDGGPATEAALIGASDVAVGPDGSIYVADGDAIRMVDPNGIITTVVGTGDRGFSGDGGPGQTAQLAEPLGMLVDGDGSLYFWDTGNLRIRKVDPDGFITTVAGTGQSGSSPDGTLAVEAQLGAPADHTGMGLAFDPEGRLLIPDLGNNRIVMIDEQGLVQAVAGNGDYEPSGDGGPAIDAGVGQPLDVVVGPDGSIYIATHEHGMGPGHRIRKVDPDGIITTVAGSDTGGRYSGDGGPAAKAELNIPSDVTIGPDGNLYIADGANNVIRVVVLR